MNKADKILNARLCLDRAIGWIGYFENRLDRAVLAGKVKQFAMLDREIVASRQVAKEMRAELNKILSLGID